MSALSFNRTRRFPRLRPEDYRVTSEENVDYNCVAWAFGIDDDWIEPTELTVAGSQFPGSPLYAGSIFSVLAAQGFEASAAPELDPALETLAVFGLDGEFTHVARQLPNGRWASKLGDWEDIEHEDLACLEGGAYGFVVARLVRRRPQ